MGLFQSLTYFISGEGCVGARSHKQKEKRGESLSTIVRRRRTIQMRESTLVLKPRETSPKVQNWGISSPIKCTYINKNDTGTCTGNAGSRISLPRGGHQPLSLGQGEDTRPQGPLPLDPLMTRFRTFHMWKAVFEHNRLGIFHLWPRVEGDMTHGMYVAFHHFSQKSFIMKLPSFSPQALCSTSDACHVVVNCNVCHKRWTDLVYELGARLADLSAWTGDLIASCAASAGGLTEMHIVRVE